MQIERIENVLHTNLTKEDMNRIRVYYLKFYNDPESFIGSGLEKMILADLGKTEDPFWGAKQVTPEEPVIFKYTSPRG